MNHRLRNLLLWSALSAVGLWADGATRSDSNVMSHHTAYENIAGNALPDSLGATDVPIESTEIRPEQDEEIRAEKHEKWQRKPWLIQLYENGFMINDPGVNYPKFMRWCVGVYNWGNKTFNSYNPDYVEGTGCNWKLMAHSFNWNQNYFMIFPKNTRVNMRGNVYSDLGPSLNFMAVSLSYTFNANELFKSPQSERRIFNFNFTCALFTASYTRSETNGGVHITRFGDYNDGKVNRRFNGVTSKNTMFDAMYFFSHRRYSHAAAYCYSKYQLKSAGSWFAGVGYYLQDIDINFSGLPEEMLEYLPSENSRFHFHYADYNVLGGYTYTWVFKPRRWSLNLLGGPALGWKHLYGDADDFRKSKDMFSLNLKSSMSAVYNHKALFAALVAKFDGHLYLGDGLTFFNSMESVALTVGCRF